MAGMRISRRQYKPRGFSGARVSWFLGQILGFAVIVAAGVACQQPVRPTEPTLGDLGRERTPDDLWDHTLAVLREHEFTPDRQDRANGRITTRPETSKQWYEPWRSDVVDKYDILLASLHTIQRSVTVQFLHEPDGWKADVTVRIYQLSEPEPQLTTASSVLHGYSGALPDREGRRLGSHREWRDIGRDGALESRLLGEILN